MFPLKPETLPKNTTTSISLRSPFAFTMGPFTIYPLFFLPLIFWISPISSAESSSTSTSATARSDPFKDLKLHPGYTQQTSLTPEQELDQDHHQSSYYSNHPLNYHQTQQPQKDRYYSPPSPVSYYPSPYSYQSQIYNYAPNSNPYMSPNSYGYPNMSPYMQSPAYSLPITNNYQSQLYDPYVLMMQLAQSQSQKFGPFSPNFSPQMSNQFFQQMQPSNPSFYSKPLAALPNYDTHQLLSAMQQDPSVILSLSPNSGQTLFTASATSEPSTQQSQTSMSQGQSPQMNYLPSSSSSSSMFSSLSPETQQLLSSLSPPFGFIDKQIRVPNEDPSEIAKNPPPKAIMTTATDILGVGLRGHNGPKSPFNFHYTPDKQTVNRYVNKNGQSHYKRKPPVFSFNSISNNRQFNLPGGLQFSFPKHYSKLKSFNGTENTLDQDFEEVEPPQKTFISEPIIPGSSISSSSSWDMIDAVMAKSKKESKSGGPNEVKSEEPEHAPEIDFKDPNEEPIPLFVTGEEEDMYFGQKDPSSDDPSSYSSIKAQIYRCPATRDGLRELSEAEIFADPLKCDQFYYCKWGRAYVFKCPVNHVFNPFSNFCERDDDFACAMSLKKK